MLGRCTRQLTSKTCPRPERPDLRASLTSSSTSRRASSTRTSTTRSHPSSVASASGRACSSTSRTVRPSATCSGWPSSTPHERVKPVRAILGGPYFGAEGASVARWIATEYAAPLSEAVRLFTPPGGTPRLAKVAVQGGESWTLRRPDVGPVDDRWASLAECRRDDFTPKANATMQRAVLDALAQGPVRVAELDGRPGRGRHDATPARRPRCGRDRA